MLKCDNWRTNCKTSLWRSPQAGCFIDNTSLLSYALCKEELQKSLFRINYYPIWSTWYGCSQRTPFPSANKSCGHYSGMFSGPCFSSLEVSYFQSAIQSLMHIGRCMHLNNHDSLRIVICFSEPCSSRTSLYLPLRVYFHIKYKF